MIISRDTNKLPMMVKHPKFDRFAQDYFDREGAFGIKTVKMPVR